MYQSVKSRQNLGWTRMTWVVVLGFVGMFLVACGDPTIPPSETINPAPKKGQTDFETTDMGGGSFAEGLPGASRDSSTQNASPSAPPSAGTDNKSPGAPSGRTGTVEEADLYRISGQLLFYLNTYKGLTLFDLKDPKNPKKLYNLPVYGYPIEMFVEKNTVYAFVRDALYLLRVNGKFQFERRYVSQLVTIDITDPKQPKILQRFDIKGQLREGVSRKIDNTVYVVSYTPRYYYWGWAYNTGSQDTEQASVYSFNVANPQAVKLVQSLELIKIKVASGSSGSSGSGSTSPGGGVVPDAPSPSTEGSRSFNGITLSATSNTLLVGERWHVWNYNNSGTNRCGQYESYQELVMHVVDISDTTGKIRVHTKFTVRGDLTDQFKQTYIYNETTKRGVYYGIFSRNEWSSANCSGDQVVKNTLVTIDITDGKNPKVLDELAFGKPNETVRGSLFDTDRGVAYAITAQQMDPLYAIDIKDPANLKVLSEIDGLSGDVNLFRFIENKNFLIAIGRDNSSACTGFGTDRVGTNLAVSIIDVRNLSKIRLVQRRCIDIKGGSWANSDINWNLDQAHKMIGMYSEGTTNLLTVPVSFYEQNENSQFRWWWYEYKSAIGIMKWDLTKYDDTKSHTEQNVLENLGTMIHPKGSVKRTIIFNLPQTNGNSRVVANLSDTHISLVDLNDLKNPAMLSTLEIAPYVRSIYRFGDHVLEQVNLGEYYDQYNEFRVKKHTSGDINDSPILSNFFVGQIRQVMRTDKYLLLFRYKVILRDNGNGKKYVDYDYAKSELLVIDMSTPETPKVRGNLEIPYNFIPYYRFFCGLSPAFDLAYGYYYWGNESSNRWVLTDSGLASLVTQYDENSRQNKTQMLFIDLTNPDKPTYNAQDLANGEQYIQLTKLDDKTFYLSLRKDSRAVTVDGQSYMVSKYFVQPWYRQGQSWKSGQAINVPGYLQSAYRDGQKVKFLTRDYGYIRHKQQDYYRYQSIFRFYLLEQDGDKASLQDFKSFTSWNLRSLLLDGNRLYLVGGRDWYYMETNKNDAYAQSDNLFIYDLSGNSFKELLSANTQTYNVQLMGIHQQRLFLNLQGDGVLIVDVRNAGQPQGVHFERTLGWLTHIEFTGDKAFLAAGHFGVYEVDLNKVTIPAL